MDPVQTAPTGSGSTLFVEEASNISADYKSVQRFVICALYVHMFEWLKQLIKFLPNK